MTYAKVINGEIVENNRTLPFSNETTSFGVGASSADLLAHGYYPVVGTEPTVSATQRINGVTYSVVGNEVVKTYGVVDIPLAELVAQAVEKYEKFTTDYIQGKVNDYNQANGLAFANIDAFTKYAMVATSDHNAIAIRFITYADKVWKALRVYQSTLTMIPTDEQVKAVLDGVVF